MIRTADGIDHGNYTIEECFEAVVERYDDGYVLCPLNWQGVKCDECLAVFEQELEREEVKTCESG